MDIKKANAIKSVIIASAFYQKIELPYRFTLTSGEIVYEKKHIKSVKLSGAYLSGIDLINTQAQFSNWQTQLPPETILDNNDEIIMSDEFNEQYYFVAHRKGKELHITWNLAENFDVFLNPQNYPDTQWHIFDFTR